MSIVVSFVLLLFLNHFVLMLIFLLCLSLAPSDCSLYTFLPPFSSVSLLDFTPFIAAISVSRLQLSSYPDTFSVFIYSLVTVFIWDSVFGCLGVIFSTLLINSLVELVLLIFSGMAESALIIIGFVMGFL